MGAKLLHADRHMGGQIVRSKQSRYAMFCQRA